MKDISTLSQSEVLLEHLLKGFRKIECINNHQLGNFEQEVYNEYLPQTDNLHQMQGHLLS